ncbi:hypothetical protein JL721_362 [Aureococcus anophagefferens]|nr:hypothetical protein JL721_362 [Aureococcus anophagefferens]
MDKNLLSKGGSSDPVVTLEVAGSVATSTTKRKQLDPVWEETFKMPLDAGDRLEVSVEDADVASGNDFMGAFKVDSAELADGATLRAWRPLVDAFGDAVGAARVEGLPAETASGKARKATVASAKVGMLQKRTEAVADARRPAFGAFFAFPLRGDAVEVAVGDPKAPDALGGASLPLGDFRDGLAHRAWRALSGGRGAVDVACRLVFDAANVAPLPSDFACDGAPNGLRVAIVDGSVKGDRDLRLRVTLLDFFDGDGRPVVPAEASRDAPHRSLFRPLPEGAVAAEVACDIVSRKGLVRGAFSVTCDAAAPTLVWHASGVEIAHALVRDAGLADERARAAKAKAKARADEETRAADAAKRREAAEARARADAARLLAEDRDRAAAVAAAAIEAAKDRRRRDPRTVESRVAGFREKKGRLNLGGLGLLRLDAPAYASLDAAKITSVTLEKNKLGDWPAEELAALPNLACSSTTTRSTLLAGPRGCARTLKMLHASRNRIRELPAEAGALLRLESLKLEANALHGDSCDFSALEALAARGRLRRLDLRRNDLLAVEDLEPHAAAVHRATVSGDLPTVARERTTIQRALTVKSRVRRRLGDDASRASDASYQGDFDALPALAPTRASKPTRLPRMGRKYVG